jgi:hypothetical protein
MKFTKEELENWKKYERVRKEGKWNMFDVNAQVATGLSKEEFVFCMKNYTELKKEYGRL